MLDPCPSLGMFIKLNFVHLFGYQPHHNVLRFVLHYVLRSISLACLLLLMTAGVIALHCFGVVTF